jgi:endo-1,4-beta-xylanase
LITELDVLDDGLPADRTIRDRLVADAYRRYLDATLQEPAVGAVIAFGLSDRYTWLQEDYPREDGAPRRPLPFDEELRPKPAYRALTESLKNAPARCPIWKTPQTDGPTEAAAG